MKSSTLNKYQNQCNNKNNFCNNSFFLFTLRIKSFSLMMTSKLSTDSAIHQGQSQSKVSNTLAPPFFSFPVRRKRTKSRLYRFVCCLTGGGLSSSNEDKGRRKVKRFNTSELSVLKCRRSGNHTVNPHSSTKISRNTREPKRQLINTTRSRMNHGKLFSLIVCKRIMFLKVNDDWSSVYLLLLTETSLDDRSCNAFLFGCSSFKWTEGGSVL